MWPKSLRRKLRLIASIFRTDELIQVAGCGLGSNPYRGDVLSHLFGSYKVRTLHCRVTLIYVSFGVLVMYCHFRKKFNLIMYFQKTSCQMSTMRRWSLRAGWAQWPVLQLGTKWTRAWAARPPVPPLALPAMPPRQALGVRTTNTRPRPPNHCTSTPGRQQVCIRSILNAMIRTKFFFSRKCKQPFVNIIKIEILIWSF